MRLALTFLLGMLLGACTASTPTAPAQSLMSDHSAGATTIASKTVVLTMGGSNCSGVWISERSILTAKHCTDASLDGVVMYSVHDDIFPDLSLQAAEALPVRVAIVSAVEDAHDLALLFALKPPTRHGVASLHEGDVEQGAFVQSMGHPLRLWYSYSTGTVAAVREKDIGDGHPGMWVQSTAPISQGNSGGGLFDSQARLVGVADAIYDDGQALNMFVHVVHIARFLAAQNAY